MCTHFRTVRDKYGDVGLEESMSSSSNEEEEDENAEVGLKQDITFSFIQHCSNKRFVCVCVCVLLV